jgi:hypothetical protein
MNGDWDDDERLAADLAEALRSERDVPARLVEAGRMAFAWHTVDAELAELSFDSSSEEDHAALAGTRAEPAVLRALTFAASQVTIEIEVTDGALLGQVVPPQPGEVEVRLVEGVSRAVPVDEVGWFLIRPRPRGMVQLHLRTASGLSVLTEWTNL